MIITDEKTAIMEWGDFYELYEYSASLPTGQTIGKRWKRAKDYHDPSKGYVMGEYAEDSNPEFVKILWRDIEIVEPPHPVAQRLRQEAERARTSPGGQHPEISVMTHAAALRYAARVVEEALRS